MGRIIVTGDTHGGAGIHRLSNRFAPPLKELGEGDAVIIAGDFGLVWDDPQSKEERYWLRWLSSKPYDVLFVDGNHENFDLLAKLPAAEMYGGTVGIAAPGVYHLRRGQVYNIAGHRVFAMGGAHSSDKEWRTPGESWWAEEFPSEAERAAAMEAARRAGRVDVVVTHEAPAKARDALVPWLSGEPDEYSAWLQELDDALEYDMWLSGHHHVDRDDGGKHAIVFERFYDVDEGWIDIPLARYLDISNMPDPVDSRGYSVGELAMYAGIPVPAMARAVDDALAGFFMDEDDFGETLVRKADLRHLEHWLEKFGV